MNHLLTENELKAVKACSEPYTCPTCPRRHECRLWKPKAFNSWHRICLRLGIPLEERGEF